MEQKNCSEDGVVLQVFGILFEDMGIVIVCQWGFLILIVGSMCKLLLGLVKKVVMQEDCLWVLLSFFNELCDVIVQVMLELWDCELKKMMVCFVGVIVIDCQQVQEMVQWVVIEVVEFVCVIYFNFQQIIFGKQMCQFFWSFGGESVMVDGKFDMDFIDGMWLCDNDLFNGIYGELGELEGV